MKKQLTFNDRVNLIHSILPQFSNRKVMQVVVAIKSKINFSKTEAELADIKEVNKRLVWNSKTALIKSIGVEFTEPELAVIKDGIDRIDKLGQVQETQLSTMDKFMPEAELEKV